MKRNLSVFARNLIVAALGLGLLTACGGGGGGGGGETPMPPAPMQFRVGGMVSGLNGSLVLQLNGETLTVASSGAFTFSQQLGSGASYQVAVTSQPMGQQCSVASGSGTIANSNISLQVNCSNLPKYVSGTVAGLSGILRLQLNTDSLTLTSDGTFAFPTPQMQGASYQVFIAQQPTGQQCELLAATGVVGAVAPNVSVNCFNTYMLGLTYSGVQGDLVLQNNGSEMRTISSPIGAVSSGTTFLWIGLRTGTAYDISIRTQPAGQQCTLTGGNGTIGNSDVVAAAIVCTNIVPTFTVGGSVTGLNGTLTLRNRDSDTITLTGNGAFAFGTSLPQGAPYQVTVVSKPATQQCTVTAGNGTVATDNITGVAVSCIDLTPHTLGGRLIGVTSPIVLRNRGDNPLTLASAGTFTFATPLVLDAEYEITATSANADQMCHVARGAGTMPDAAVGNISVVCNTKRPTRFVYVANEGELNIAGGISGASISQYAVGTDGTLMPLTPAEVTAGVRPGAITIDPSGQFVYVRSGNGTSGGTTIWQFNISASGALAPMSTPSVSSFDSIGSMVIDPAGAYLYSSRGLDLLRYPINADGSLATPLVQTLLTTGGLRGITFDRAGEHAYIGGENEHGDGVVYQFSVASDGSLTAMTPPSIEIGLPFAYAPFGEPFDRFMYTIDNAFSRIVQFQRNENATLARLNHEPTYSATVFPWDMQAEPFGRFAYVIAPATISTFDIGETGLLTPSVPASVSANFPESFTAFTLDFSGENAYVTGSDPDNDIYVLHQYRIGADGALTKIVWGSVATGIRPRAIAVAP